MLQLQHQRTAEQAITGIQRPHSTLQSWHTNPRAHHRPARSLIPLLTTHASHSDTIAQRSGRAADEE
jgi:hypothetical protein